ncbi:PucR C-terminal helix-turn-helix domain-containing protein [Arthrobacter sp. VKM Ac-2550]|nr:PucR C-terminal helix-turn-helix domain-containing protein [Arthrobacter sp. VKM Ac-2550]
MRRPGQGRRLDLSTVLARGSLRSTTALYLAPSSTVIDGVMIVPHLDAIRRVPPNTVVVLSTEMGAGGWLVSAALRHAWERRSSAVVVPESRYSSTVIGLAERLDITLLAAGQDPASVALDLAAEIGAARSVVDVQLANLVRALIKESTVTGVLRGISQHLGGILIALEYDGVLVASAGSTGKDDGQVSVDLRSQENSSRGMALTAQIPADEAYDRQFVRTALEMAVPSVQSAWLQVNSREDRDAVPSAALVDLTPFDTAADDKFEDRHRHLMTELGWHRGQRYVAVWIWHDPNEPHRLERTAVLRLLWRRVGIRRPLAEVEEGWLSIIPCEEDQRVAQLQQRVNAKIGRALAEFHLAAGLSRWQAENVTLPAIVREAKIAAECAYLTGPGNILAFGSLNVQAATFFMNQETIQQVAHLALPQLMAAPDREQMISSLASYLDHHSSVSSAAKALNLHRNTLQTRLHRARELGVPLDDPHQLLATHMILHVLNDVTSRTTRHARKDSP